jgi:hypothetical protein
VLPEKTTASGGLIQHAYSPDGRPVIIRGGGITDRNYPLHLIVLNEFVNHSIEFFEFLFGMKNY